MVAEKPVAGPCGNHQPPPSLDASTNIDFNAGELVFGLGETLVAGFVLLNNEGSLVQLNSRIVRVDIMMAEYFIKGVLVYDVKLHHRELDLKLNFAIVLFEFAIFATGRLI